MQQAPAIAERRAQGVVENARGLVSLERALGNLRDGFRIDAHSGQLLRPDESSQEDAIFVPPFHLQNLGDRQFCADHRLRYAYVSGAMANGIGSAELVEAMSRAGLLAFFGAAGLAPKVVEAAIDRLAGSLPNSAYGFNLIHSPNEPDLEAAVADLYLRRGIRLVEASAYLGLTLPIVRYRVHGIHQDASDRIVAPNRVIAKVSRVEVAAKFFAPPPADMLRELRQSGRNHARPGGPGRSHTDGARCDGRGGLCRSYRQPPGHHAAADAFGPSQSLSGTV